MNHKEFISKNKSLLIAPAGYGKTHSVIESLLYAEGRQLVLTHTHAGVASIKFKLQRFNVPSKKVHVETISGYAQKHVLSYCSRNEVPSQENAALYFAYIVSKAAELLRHPILQKVVKASYSGVFVDEYQDCTLLQHDLVLALSEILPTRILGDPLQGIFNFDGAGTMVDLDSKFHMGAFHDNRFALQEPWRWKGQNERLGEDLKAVRSNLESKNDIDLLDFSAIEFHQMDADEDLYNPKKEYYKDVSNLLKASNLLVLHPDSANVNPRKKVISVFKMPIKMIEAIDDKTFYEFAKLFDDLSNRPAEGVIYTVCLQLFNKTEVNTWIHEKGSKKRTKDGKETAQALGELYCELGKENQLRTCALILRQIEKLPAVRCYRKELFQSLCAAMEEADDSGGSVYEAMLAKRNIVRRVGRKVYGRCIGTTLLTKGLEFDTVVILNAHRFSCRKNLYVALTRACKRLVVFSNKSVLSPYSAISI